MSAPPSTRADGCLVSIAHWVAFLLLYPVSLCLVGAAVAVFIVASVGLESSPDQASLGSPGFLGATAMLQITTLAVGAAALSLLFPADEGGAVQPELSLGKLARGLGLKPARGVWFAVALPCALTLGLLPGWVAERLMQLPQLEGIADQMRTLGESLADPSAPGWIVLALAVGVTAPLCEELIFRGYLWRAAEFSLPPAGVWLATSALFAAYHLNPIHVISVLPIGLFLGWLRWVSGSVWPGILAHFTNNALAIGLTVLLGSSEDETGLALALGTFAASIGVAAAGWTWARRTAPELP